MIVKIDVKLNGYLFSEIIIHEVLLNEYVHTYRINIFLRAYYASTKICKRLHQRLSKSTFAIIGDYTESNLKSVECFVFLLIMCRAAAHFNKLKKTFTLEKVLMNNKLFVRLAVPFRL